MQFSNLGKALLCRDFLFSEKNGAAFLFLNKFSTEVDFWQQWW